MANVKISDLAPAQLPLDLPNTLFEVQTFEAGIPVSRKLAADDLTVQGTITVEDEGTPLATGADTLNFTGAGVTASGTGSTKTIDIPGGSGGQVDSVVGGVNITVDATDPINPIVNLDAAITGVSVNGVTLTTAGVATNYLDETGNYSTPAGGSPGGANTAVQFNNAGAFGGSPDFEWDGSILKIEASQAQLTLDETDGGGVARIFLTSTTTADSALLIDFDSTSGTDAFIRQGTSGGTPQDVWINFAKDGEVGLHHNNVKMARTVAAASGGLEVNNTVTGAGFERVLTTSDAGGGTPGGPANSIQYNSGGSFAGDANFTWTSLSGELELTHPAGFGSGRPAFEINQNAANAEVFVINTNQAGPGNVIMELTPNAGTAGFRLETDWSGADNTHHVRWVNDLGQERLLLQYDGLSRIGGVLFDLPNATLEFGTYVLEFTEQASGNPAAATIGQLWVRNDTPNVLIFTDDAGTDFVLNGGGGGGVNSVTAGTNLNDTGTAADPILNVDDPLIIGSINATSALNDTTVGSPYLNVPLNIGANLVGTQGMTQYSRQRIQARPSSFGYNSTLFINIQGEPGTNGANTFIGGLNSAGIEVDFGVEVNLRHGVAPGNSAPVMSTFTRGIKLPQGSIYVTQTATPGANDTNSGQFWVRNDTVQKPMFTDDAGRDHNLIAEFDEQTSDTTVNNSTTLVNTQIDFSNIPTGHYRIDMLVLLRDVAVSGCGARVQISLSGADPDSVMRVVNKNFSGAGTPSYDEVGLVGDLFDNMPLVTGSGTSRFMFSGIVEFISGTNGFTVQFAQNTALVGDLDFESGSWCSLTRVGP